MRFLFALLIFAAMADAAPSRPMLKPHPQVRFKSARADAGRNVSPSRALPGPAAERAALGAARARGGQPSDQTGTTLGASSLASPDWIRTMSTGLVHSSDAGTAVAVNPADGSVYVAGSAETDYLTVKMNPSGDTLWTARFHDPLSLGSVPAALSVDSGGNVLVTGISADDIVTLKYSATGALQWSARYDGPDGYDDQPVAMTVDKPGNVYVAGYSYSNAGGYDVVTLKYSPAGAGLWAARYDGSGNDDDEPAGIAVDAGGNVAVAGYLTNTDFSHDYLTLRYNSLGQQLWAASYDGPGHDDDAATGVAVLSDGSVCVTGYSLNQNLSYDYATIQYASTGVRRWVARYNGDADLDDQAAAIAVASNGDAVVTGNTGDFFGGLTAVTIRYNSAGALLWSVPYSGPPSTGNYPAAVLIDKNGDLFVGGETDEPSGPARFLFVRYTGAGAQTWAAVLPADTTAPSAFPSGLAVDGSGGAVSSGFTTGVGATTDILTIKAGSAGTEQWRAAYDGPNHSEETARAVACDGGGNVYVTGLSRSSATSGDFLTAKYSAAGDLRWAVRYNGPGNGDDDPAAIVVDRAGNVVVAGRSDGLGGVSDYAVVKYDSSGGRLWAARYDGGLADEPRALAVDSSGSVYVTGKSNAPGTASDIATVKYSSAGALQWAARYDGPSHGNDEGLALTVDRAQRVEVAGTTAIPAGKSDVVLIRYSPSGVKLWSAVYAGPAGGNDRPAALATDSVNDSYLCGYSEGSGTLDDILVLKYDSTGFRNWVTTFNGTGNGGDRAAAICVDNAGSSFVAGYSRSISGNDDIVTMKLDTGGVRLWTAYDDGGGPGGDYPAALRLDASGNVFVAGNGDAPGGEGFTALKYDPAGEILWKERLISSGAQAAGIALDAAGDAAVAGTSDDGIPATAWTTFRYQATHAGFSIPSHAVAFGDHDITCGPDAIGIPVSNTGDENLWLTASLAGDSSYGLLPAAAMVAPGAAVQFTVSFSPVSMGPKAATVFFNHGASDTVAVSGNGTGTGTETTFNEHYGTSWQLISLPVVQACPNVPGNLFDYHAHYLRKDTLLNGFGYWKKLATPDLRFIGYAHPLDSVAVGSGWNLLGSVSAPVPVASIVQIPPSIRSSAIYGYNGGSGGAYFIADTIKPAHAYWVKVRQAGTLVLNAGAGKRVAEESPAIGERAAAAVTVADARGRSAKLYLADRESAQYLLLPPPPPEGSFDLRFASGRMAEDAAAPGTYAIVLSGAAYPLRISWMVKDAAGASLRAGGKTVALAGEGSVEVRDASPLALVVGGAAASRRLPAAFALGQNYPNPFNPATTIGYDLPLRAHVTLALFDMLGRRVQTLVDAVEDPGERKVVLDASALAAGAYCYRLSALPLPGGAPFVANRKLLLIK